MKAKAIVVASVLLVGCHVSGHDTNAPKQHAQSLSTPGANDKHKNHLLSSRWSGAKTSSTRGQNLWTHIRNGLKMKVPDNPLVREQKQNYLKDKSCLSEVILRAEPYMYWIVEQINIRKMPMELVLLPIVESSFNPHATSSSNAAGIWQIIPSTGRHYGLKQNAYYDGRRDILASTKVALDIMERLNKMFDGDWLVTIAAYNSGEGRVMNAIRQNQMNGQPTDFWSLSLPRETTIYIPKMLALSDILKHYIRYGVQLPKPDGGRALTRVEIGQQIELNQAARMAGMKLAALKSFNAGYKTHSTAPDGPQYIMVPKAKVIRLRSSLASRKIAAVQPRKSERRGGSHSYIVRPGDTLSGIAKRMKVTVRDLKRNNKLRGALVKPGQKLIVTVKAG